MCRWMAYLRGPINVGDLMFSEDSNTIVHQSLDSAHPQPGPTREPGWWSEKTPGSPKRLVRTALWGDAMQTGVANAESGILTWKSSATARCRAGSRKRSRQAVPPSLRQGHGATGTEAFPGGC